MTTENWTLEKGLCRCCHAEGNFKSLACVDYGQELIYADMLKNCFNINLAPVPGILCVLTYTICSACIAKLSDAVKFKKEVARCEEKFKEFFNKNLIKAPGSVIEVPVKKELPHSCNGDDFSLQDDNKDSFDDLPDYGYDDDDNDDDMAVKEEQLDSSNDGSSILKSMLISPKENVKKKSKKGQKSKTQTKKKGRPKKIKEEPIAEEGEERKKRPAPKFRLNDEDYTLEGDIFSCARCDKKYDKIFSLRYHVRTKHYKLPRFICPYCKKGFMTVAPLTVHKLEAHNIDERFKCNACKGIFNTKVQLRKHKNNFHMLGERFKCEMCEYESFSFEGMYKHKFKHKTSKDHQCKFCRKAFVRKTTLALHERIHTGDRRKVCSVCSQAFVQKASLNYHMTKYHPEVNY